MIAINDDLTYEKTHYDQLKRMEPRGYYLKNMLLSRTGILLYHNQFEFVFNLRTRKVHSFEISKSFYVCRFKAVNQHTRTFYELGKDKRYQTINTNSRKIKHKGQLSVGTLCIDEKVFSPNCELLILRAHVRQLHIFSLGSDIQLLKSFTLEFKSKELFVNDRTLFITHVHDRSVTHLDLADIYRLKKKSLKSLKAYKRKIETLDYLCKRIDRFGRAVTASVRTTSLRPDAPLPAPPKHILEGKKSRMSKQARRISQLNEKLTELEESVSRPISINKVLDFFEEKIDFFSELFLNKK